MDSPAPGRRKALLRLGAYLTLLAVIFATVAITGSLPSANDARTVGDDLGPFAAVAYVPLFVLANFIVPWAILAGAGGLLFGTVLGWPLALAGVTAAALTQMLLARTLVKEQAGRMLPKRIQSLEGFLQHNGVVAVMESRIVPLLPYGVVNHAAGLTGLRFRDMAVGTAVGAAPKAFAYVALGGSLSNLSAPEVKVALGVLVVLGVVGLVVARRRMADEAGAASV
jgi:uncharacterized membrane protein YdjX (TVP38/TMEM64 family)